MVIFLADELPKQDGNGNVSGAESGLVNSVAQSFNAARGVFASFGGNLPDAFKPAATIARLQFPSNLSKYKMVLQFSDYFRPSVFQPPKIHMNTQIILPMPANLVDALGVGYSEEQLSPVVGSIAESIGGGGAKNAGAAAAEIAGGLGIAATAGAIQGVANLAGRLASIAGSNGGGISNIPAAALQMGGLAANPFLTIMFRSPRYKKHEFAWRLSPNNAEESNNLTKIINKMRYAMLPDTLTGTGGVILTYPNLLHIKLLPNEESMYTFKPCVVESVSVDYAPNGVPSFFGKTNAPTEIELRLNVLEVEYWLKRHIDQNTGQPVSANRISFEN